MVLAQNKCPGKCHDGYRVARLAYKDFGISYLICGAGLVTCPDQVGGVGQVNEQFLLRLQSRSWKIQQENLRRKGREHWSDEDLWVSPERSSWSDLTEDKARHMNMYLQSVTAESFLCYVSKYFRDFPKMCTTAILQPATMRRSRCFGFTLVHKSLQQDRWEQSNPFMSCIIYSFSSDGM